MFEEKNSSARITEILSSSFRTSTKSVSISYQETHEKRASFDFMQNNTCVSFTLPSLLLHDISLLRGLADRGAAFLLLDNTCIEEKYRRHPFWTLLKKYEQARKDIITLTSLPGIAYNIKALICYEMKSIHDQYTVTKNASFHDLLLCLFFQTYTGLFLGYHFAPPHNIRPHEITLLAQTTRFFIHDPLQFMDHIATWLMHSFSPKTSTPTSFKKHKTLEKKLFIAPCELAQSSGYDAHDNVYRPYKIFTTRYDEVKKAENLVSYEEKKFLQRRFYMILSSAKKEHTFFPPYSSYSLHDSLPQEEGLLNNTYFARYIANNSYSDIYKKAFPDRISDVAISFLIDSSGSMRGTPIENASLCAHMLGKYTYMHNIPCEIIGFTTTSWRGGKSRMAWHDASSPPFPGRLNDIRYIIYKTAYEPLKASSVAVMLTPRLLKENIDGEALLWAAHRLKYQKETRKVLIILSDGIPIDNSSLSENNASFLKEHLKKVIYELEHFSSIDIFAIGTGKELSGYYAKTTCIPHFSSLVPAFSRMLSKIFMPSERKKV